MTTTSLALPVADVRLLARFAYLAVAAALATIALKTLAWRLTGSAGLLSDALESVVNLAAAVLAVVVLRWSAKPPDDEHTYGHAKAEYVSAGAEGAMILIAAASIAWIAIERLISPAPLQDIGIGLVISVGASLINLAVGLALLRAGGQHRSVTLEADGRHLPHRRLDLNRRRRRRRRRRAHRVGAPGPDHRPRRRRQHHHHWRRTRAPLHRRPARPRAA